MSEYIPRRKQVRLTRFVEDLGKQFEAERDRVDQEFVKTDEFEGLLEEVAQKAQERKHEDKLGYWAKLLAGFASTARPTQADRLRFIDTMDALRRSHLYLLHVIATTREGPPNMTTGQIPQTLAFKMPGSDLNEVRREWDDLARHDLVQGWTGGMMSAAGAGDLTVRLTDHGRAFVALLTLGDPLLEPKD